MFDEGTIIFFFLFQVNGIDYRSFAAPNNLDFNKTFIGTLMKSIPLDLCEPMSAIPTLGDDAVINPILIATIGHCNIAHKVANAKAAGANMVIVVSHLDSLHERGHHSHRMIFRVFLRF
jgi:hypothetical protein